MISCLRGAGVEVAEVHVPVWEGRRHKFDVGATAALRLLLAQTELGASRATDADAVIVGYPGHLDLGRAKRLGIPIVFNPLVSLWDTFVNDRGALQARRPEGTRAPSDRPQRLPRGGSRGLGHRCARGALPLARRPAGGDVLRRRGGANLPARVEPGRPSQALFVGKLIPLHGLETILAAARLGPDIRFLVVGSGQLDRLLEERPPNVEHVSVGRVRAAPGRAAPRRRARSGSSAPRRRRSG